MRKSKLVFLSLNEFFGRIEEEGDLSWLLNRIVEGWSRHILWVASWYTTLGWVLGYVSTFGNGRLWEPGRYDKWLRLVFARAWHFIDRLHWADRVAESVIVVLNIDFTSFNLI